jgi:hypothetical protein
MRARLVGATCGKISREIYIIIKTEYGEVEEPVPAGTVWQFNDALKGKSAASLGYPQHRSRNSGSGTARPGSRSKVSVLPVARLTISLDSVVSFWSPAQRKSASWAIPFKVGLTTL